MKRHIKLIKKMINNYSKQVERNKKILEKRKNLKKF